MPRLRLDVATRSLQPGQQRCSLDPHAVELVRIDAEDIKDCRGDLRCRDGCVDSLLGKIGMRNQQGDVGVVLVEAAMLRDL